jgi:hypothetical protein
VSAIFSNHVPSDRLGEAAQRNSLEGLRDAERRHVAGCVECQHLYGGYRLADRLLVAPWREAKLPVESVAQPRRLRFVPALRASLVGGLTLKSLAPAAAALGVVLLIGAAVVLPQLIPPATPTLGPGTQVSHPSGSGSPDASQTAAPSGTTISGTTSGTTSGPRKTSGGGAKATPTAGKSGTPTPVAKAAMQGEPIAWAPDGRHLLVAKAAGGWGGKHQIQIRDAAGKVTGTCDGDDAAWVDSATVAVAKVGHGSEATVSLYAVDGHKQATLPGTYTEDSATTGLNGGMLIGSGHGQLAIADQGGRSVSEFEFVVWDGHSISAARAGVPIAWSADGRWLAVLTMGGHATQSGSNAASTDRTWGDGSKGGRQPGFAPGAAVTGSSITGSLQVMSGAGLKTVTTVSGSFRVSAGSPVYGYSLDAVFSPDGRRLLISGTLVDLGTATTRQVGQGDWLPDGTLVTTSGGHVLRWQGTSSSVESRLPGGGVIETSNRGDVIEYFTDGRAPQLLGADGTVHSISLAGTSSIANLLLSPTGKAIAYNGRASGGSLTAAVVTLE